MPYYMVTLIQTREWCDYYEADSQEEAIEMARLESNRATVIDESALVEVIQPAEVTD